MILQNEFLIFRNKFLYFFSENELKSHFVILLDDFFILEIYFLIYENEFLIFKIGHIFILEIRYLSVKKINIAKPFL